MSEALVWFSGTLLVVVLALTGVLEFDGYLRAGTTGRRDVD